MGILDLITLLIFLAAGFTLINITYLKLPSTIGLMAIALVMSVIVLISGIFIPHLTDVAVHIMEEFDFEEVLLHVMLSFLLFAGALSIDLSKLAEERLPILVLATFGVIMSTFIVGYLMFQVFQYVGSPVPLVYCLLFGSVDFANRSYSRSCAHSEGQYSRRVLKLKLPESHCLMTV